jgi:hypothetical protein
VDPKADQRWPVYARSLLAFSAVSVLGLYAMLRFQPHLPLSLGFGAVAPDQAFNTAASFITNTNWQSYSGESTMSHLVQMAGLAVQNFGSAAVGMAVAVALIRGFTRSRRCSAAGALPGVGAPTTGPPHRAFGMPGPSKDAHEPPGRHVESSCSECELVISRAGSVAGPRPAPTTGARPGR